jgi:hypothetical protein
MSIVPFFKTESYRERVLFLSSSDSLKYVEPELDKSFILQAYIKYIIAIFSRLGFAQGGIGKYEERKYMERGK